MARTARLPLACMLVALTVLSTLAASSAGAQDAGIDFVVEPGPDSDTAPGGGFFLVESKPGENVTQSLSLRNDSDAPLTLRLAPVDASTGPFGGVSYALEGEQASATAAWLSVERASVHLTAGQSAMVDLGIEVPSDAQSGQYLAGMSVWLPAPEGEATSAPEGEAGAGIRVRTRRIVAVQVNVPGPSEPELTISGVDAAARPDGLYVEIDIANVGRGLTQGEGLIEIPSADFEESFDVDTFVPGTAIAYPVRWDDDVASGEYDAEVEIVYDEDRIATWQGTVVVGEGVLDELANRGGAAPGTPMPRWAVIAVGAVVVMAGALFLARRRRRPAIAGIPACQRPAVFHQRAASPYVPTGDSASTARHAPPPPPRNSRRVPPPPPPQVSRRSPPPPPPEPIVRGRR